MVYVIPRATAPPKSMSMGLGESDSDNEPNALGEALSRLLPGPQVQGIVGTRFCEDDFTPVTNNGTSSGSFHQMARQRMSTVKGDQPNSNSNSLDKQEYSARLASAVMLWDCAHHQSRKIHIERHSVYGAALVIPQLARSAGWPKTLSFLAVRTYIFLFVNVAIQACLLYLIAKEERVMDIYAGQMNLCDFGADLESCPGGAGCMGPGGSDVTAARLFPWDQWATRVFVRDSLKKLFPNMSTQIDDVVDPGEYGVESMLCRHVCAFLFVLSVINDLLGNVSLLRLLWHAPSTAESWITYEDILDFDDEDDGSQIELSADRVRLQVAGIPRCWKLITFLLVSLPKFALWKVTAEFGVCFLMETSGIDDTIVNSVALTFILTIDEMIFDSLMSDTAKRFMSVLEDFTVSDDGMGSMSAQEIVDQYLREEGCSSTKGPDILKQLPWKLFFVGALTAFFCHRYYTMYCELDPSGKWVSRTMRFPKHAWLSFGAAFFPDIIGDEKQDPPFWEMPNEG